MIFLRTAEIRELRADLEAAHRSEEMFSRVPPRM